MELRVWQFLLFLAWVPTQLLSEFVEPECKCPWPLAPNDFGPCDIGVVCPYGSCFQVTRNRSRCCAPDFGCPSGYRDTGGTCTGYADQSCELGRCMQTGQNSHSCCIHEQYPDCPYSQDFLTDMVPAGPCSGPMDYGSCNRGMCTQVGPKQYRCCELPKGCSRGMTQGNPCDLMTGGPDQCLRGFCQQVDKNVFRCCHHKGDCTDGSYALQPCDVNRPEGNFDYRCPFHFLCNKVNETNAFCCGPKSGCWEKPLDPNQTTTQGSNTPPVTPPLSTTTTPPVTQPTPTPSDQNQREGIGLVGVLTGQMLFGGTGVDQCEQECLQLANCQAYMWLGDLSACAFFSCVSSKIPTTNTAVVSGMSAAMWASSSCNP